MGEIPKGVGASSCAEVSVTCTRRADRSIFIAVLDVMAFGVLPILTIPKNRCIQFIVITLYFPFSLHSFGKIEPSLLISVLYESWRPYAVPLVRKQELCEYHWRSMRTSDPF